VKDVKAGQAYDFVVKAVDERDNSTPSFVNTESIKPMAPTNPTVDDGFNTYGWTDVPGYSEPTDYEYSVNNGQTWKQVTANPQPVGDGEIRAGAVQVRVKSNEETGDPAGLPLKSNKDFTENNVHDVYSVERTLTRGKELAVNVKINQQAAYSDDAYVVFELFKGNRSMMINAIPIH